MDRASFAHLDELLVNVQSVEHVDPSPSRAFRWFWGSRQLPIRARSAFGWVGNVYGLDGLQVPANESNAIVTFHYYTPSLFCFQGKSFSGPDFATTGITWPGPPPAPVTPAPGVGQWAIDWIQAYDFLPEDQNPAGRAVIQSEIATAVTWGEEHRRPIWMSEFTAQDGADLASRARWISFVRSTLEGARIPWSFWTLLSDSGTKIYDVSSGKWTPELTQGLGITTPR